MTVTAKPPGHGAPAPQPPPPPANLARRRIAAMSIWMVAFLIGWLVIGLPTDPLYAFAWLWTATIAWNSHRPRRSHLGFARDWLPVVLLLAAYNLVRGLADNGATPHAQELIDADVWLIGWATGGQVPTVWLQQRFYDPAVVHWWDAVASWVYFSHFVVALTVAVVLWLRDRHQWARFMRRWFFLCAAGLVTYYLYPAAPPWWAARYGLIEEVARISTRGWKAIGMHGAGNLLNAGQVASNPVAAMPSLHTAFALFVVVFFLTGVRRRWWPLMLGYPLAMTLTLVYAGEHYIIDVLVGWAYVGLTFLVVGAGERWWEARRGRKLAAEPSPAAPGPPAGPIPAVPQLRAATTDAVPHLGAVPGDAAPDPAAGSPAGAAAGRPPTADRED